MRILFACQELARTALQPSHFGAQPPALPSTDGGKTAAPSRSRGVDAFGPSLSLRHSIQSMLEMPRSVLVRRVYELGHYRSTNCLFDSAEPYANIHAVEESKIRF